MSPDEIRERASQFQWYHTIDLGHGVVTRGDYDLRPLLREYGIPASLAGKSVLDVGPGHGFFSFEFERRGAARVTTAELPDWTGHEASPVLRQEFARLESGTTMEPYLHRALYAIRSRTREQAIISTRIDTSRHVRKEARALFLGTATGQAFWFPTMK